MAERDAFTLDHIDAHGSRVEQDIDNMVIQQVDFVNVEQPAVGSRKHARFEMAFAFLDGAFDVECAHNAIFGGGDGQIYKGGGMVIVRKGVFTLKEALLAFSTPGGWFV